MIAKTLRPALLAVAITVFASGAAVAQKKYDAGATDTEIRIGNTSPYSGPASSYGVIGKTEESFFKMINDKGGINGRKIKFISYDDGYSPPKTVEQVRKLVESDEVLLLFSSIGTPTNSAVQKYLNTKKVPQLFVASGAKKWDDPNNFPWTMGFLLDFQTEAQIYAKWLMKEKPDAKIGILYQNDDFGKEYLRGVKDGLGAKASSMIMIEESYEVSEPSIDSHIIKLKAANPDVLMIFATIKSGAQAIKRTAELGWKPLQIINNGASFVSSVMKPAGFENAQGVLSAAYAKDGADPQWNDDPGMKRVYEFLDKYMPGADKTDGGIIHGYGVSQTLVKVLEMCGDDLTRANVMKQAASLRDYAPDTLLPGVKINTSLSSYAPITQLRMQLFKGEKWELFGDLLSRDAQRE
ncbi:ABC transporter substrate-binding protein [Bradyrhizobium sp. Cp5.3]|uniref:ABC transporter substrate-binding protein n=1 Tax=Bradyrhizobium sp. Cp5.3 TaxID=443598 RepID=UPI0004052791|nr:ABC transporter substrate-binding protein [Bradyrhizobium sp. Cp5.3]